MIVFYMYCCEFANIIFQNKEENAKDDETKTNTNKPTKTKFSTSLSILISGNPVTKSK